MEQSPEETALGLRPRLFAAGWFALTACMPIAFFFGIMSRGFSVGLSGADDVAMVSIFISLPISMAAFFGFLIGSKILNPEKTVRGGRAAGYGLLVAILSYLGFTLVFGGMLLFQSSAPAVEAIGGFLTVFVVGALLVGWLIMLAGALGGLVLFWVGQNRFREDRPSITEQSEPHHFNLWATVVLLVVLFLCYLPVRTMNERKRAEDRQRDLFDAVEQNRSGMVDQLLADGMSADARDLAGRSLLGIAAANGETRIVKILLDRGANPNPETDRSGQTPLHFAAANFDVESIKALLDHGANVNAPDEYGRTPLILAASTTDRETVKLLIERGANINWKDRYGNTALSLARRDRDLTGNRDRTAVNTPAMDAGRNYGDSRDLQNPIVMKRARDRHDAIIELLAAYALKH
jgi:hypothetical protein